MAYLRKHAMLLTAAGLALLRCAASSPTTSVGAGGSTTVCLAGQRVPCGCANGSESARACKSDGSGYFACICDAVGTSGEGGVAGEAAGGAGAAG